MVAVSTLLAVLVGIPRYLITRWPSLNKPVLGSANIIQTIPSLASLDFCCPAWIGARADRLAILALSLYALRRSSATLMPDQGVIVGVEAGPRHGMTIVSFCFRSSCRWRWE